MPEPSVKPTDLERTIIALKGANVSGLQRPLLAGAALFVIIFGIRYTAPVTTPLLFGLMLAILIRPLHQAILNRGVPGKTALFLTILSLSAILLALGLFVFSAFRSIQNSLSTYKTELTQQLESLNLPTTIAPPEQMSSASISVLGGIVDAAASTISTLIIAVVLAAMLTIEIPRLKQTLTSSVG